ncbi:MAG: SURF1 family protein [Pseudomonadota bacterium]
MRARPLWVDLILIALACVILVSLVSLGNWQMRRLAWKTDLITAVETRAFSDPVAAPTGAVNADEDAYRRVHVTGTFQHDSNIRVKALTDLGGGSWLLTPLLVDDSVVWVNRGFVPAGTGDEVLTRPTGLLEVTGLLRITEPGGTFLQQNDTDAERWYSRDVAAMSAARGIENARAYFIDADHAGAPAAWPRGGLTQLSFRNTHLSYALTWYAMALLFFGAMVYVIKDRIAPARRDLSPNE